MFNFSQNSVGTDIDFLLVKTLGDKMKSKIVISLFVFLFAFTQTSARRIEFVDFHRILSKHGNWVNVNRVGLVWTPINVERDWKPYTNGRWFWTEFGWFWDSEDPFGWITHHYGRWENTEYYGWIWHPGYEWAPAWVKWRISGDYIGWQPLTPNGRFNHAYGLYFDNSVYVPFTTWNFVKINKIKNQSIGRHLVRSHRIAEIYKYSEAVSDYYVLNDVVFCGANLTDTRFRRIKNDIHIVNLHFTNDYIRISELGIDYWLGIPNKPYPPIGPGDPIPDPVPLPRHIRPPVVKNPRPPDIVAVPTHPVYRDPVPSRPIKGKNIRNESVRKNELKKVKNRVVVERKKERSKRVSVTKNRSN